MVLITIYLILHFHEFWGKFRNQRLPLFGNHDAITTKYDVRTSADFKGNIFRRAIFTLTIISIAFIVAELSGRREGGFSPPPEDETMPRQDMVSLNEDLLICNFSIAECSVTTISVKSTSILFRI